MGKNLTRSTLALAVVGAMSSFAMANESLTNGAEKDTTQLQTIVLTAEEQVKQSLGASIITDKDLEKLNRLIIDTVEKETGAKIRS